MGYRWKPNASQRAEFRERMKDENERRAYKERKRLRHSYQGFKDGSFIPTKEQHDWAMAHINDEGLTMQQVDACNQVMGGWATQDQVHHDYIHIVNEMRRAAAAAAYT